MASPPNGNTADVPEAFQCPITQELMVDPVMDPMGHNFEKESIQAWLVRHQTCPMGREALSMDKLYPNRTLKQQITDWQRLQGGSAGASTAATAAIRPSTPPPSSNPNRPPPPPPSFNPNEPWTKYGLDQEEYDRAMCMFMTFDEDGSGELDRRELTRLAKYMNYPNTETDIARMFQLMDTNRSGTLDLDEFLTYMKDKRPKPEVLYGIPRVQYEQFMMQFHTSDADQDGELSPNELAGLCTKMGYPIPRDQLSIMFAAIDTNRSGTLDAHEFLTYMRFNDPRRPTNLVAPPQFQGPQYQQQQPPPSSQPHYHPPPSQYPPYPPPPQSLPYPPPPPPYSSQPYSGPPPAYGAPQSQSAYGSNRYSSGHQQPLLPQGQHGRHGQQQEKCTIS